MEAELIALVDKAIAHCSGRDIVSTTEMTDMLLDMRILLVPAPTESEIPA